MTADADPRRTRDAVTGFLVSMVAAALLATISGLAVWYLVFPIAGAIAGGVVRDRTAGWLGLLGGFLIVSVIWGVQTVMGQIQSCQPDCVGLSSPSITVVLVVIVGVAIELGVTAGFIAGRVLRRMTATDRPA